ncbi:separin isoform X1 [Colletes gigas]|uniref:separin isoform X1 n=1 Tax=Colletes gigas TaxID=935657 RepID=UPI001C9ACF37|nr:separin isoform X1 [Colletes gigas]
MEEIFQILHESNLNNEEESEDIAESGSLQNLKRDTEELLANARCTIGSVEYASLNKMLAICYLKMGNELEAICRLIESHAVILRQQILHRCVKTKMQELILNTKKFYGLRSSYVEFDINLPNSVDNVKAKLFDLPTEWYVIQITAQYKSPGISENRKSIFNEMQAVHIIVLPTGTKETEPLCITLPKPKFHYPYDICDEIQKILSNNRSELEATYANHELYWKMRNRQNDSMRTAIHALEYTWLREWRILFMADPIDKHDLVTDIVQMIDKLISDNKVQWNIPKRSVWLLKKIALGACFLTREEIAYAVKYVLSGYDKLADNIILSIYGKLSCIQELKDATRKTLVLIVDEHMDYIPFESMKILQCHPITRFPSLHVAHALFKEHESTMKNGCKIITVKNDMGTCIVNPSGNLCKMEKRIRLFIEHWLPNWKSSYGVEPQEIFKDTLINRDILMYNGHGNGIQYLPGEQIERLKVKSIVLLFGCSSVKLLEVGGRYPPHGVSNRYLIGSSPCVLGMLWEITDVDIDKMTTNFISSWIPSPLNRPWADVDINMWLAGILKFPKNSQKVGLNIPLEPEMLRAVAKSKYACSQYMTAAAIVIRGLPIKLI